MKHSIQKTMVLHHRNMEILPRICFPPYSAIEKTHRLTLTVHLILADGVEKAVPAGMGPDEGEEVVEEGEVEVEIIA